jgi:hypothetical protein
MSGLQSRVLHASGARAAIRGGRSWDTGSREPAMACDRRRTRCGSERAAFRASIVDAATTGQYVSAKRRNDRVSTRQGTSLLQSGLSHRPAVPVIQ